MTINDTSIEAFEAAQHAEAIRLLAPIRRRAKEQNDETLKKIDAALLAALDLRKKLPVVRVAAADPSEHNLEHRAMSLSFAAREPMERIGELTAQIIDILTLADATFRRDVQGVELAEVQDYGLLPEDQDDDA